MRSIDGSGNNLENPELGTAGTEFRRLVDPDYADVSRSHPVRIVPRPVRSATSWRRRLNRFRAHEV